jgi:dolichyl-phosphate beta-glucosyltransferase
MKKLSIIIPAYNEETRIREFLRELIDYSKKNLDNYEIIIVNDGSKDKTREVIKKIIHDCEKARLINYKTNKGKGHAVLQGVLAAKGDFTLFIDADGSIQPKEIMQMYKAYHRTNVDVIIGSRKSSESYITLHQPLHRRFFSKIFNLYSNFLFRVKINDLLCGFKGFSRSAAEKIFNNLRAFRWEFDVEILYRARKEKYRILELPIEWKHQEGSKIKKLDPLFIFVNLLILRLRYI